MHRQVSTKVIPGLILISFRLFVPSPRKKQELQVLIYSSRLLSSQESVEIILNFSENPKSSSKHPSIYFAPRSPKIKSIMLHFSCSPHCLPDPRKIRRSSKNTAVGNVNREVPRVFYSEGNDVFKRFAVCPRDAAPYTFSKALRER